MDTDLVLTGGILLLVLSLPSLLAGWVEQRVSKLGALMFFSAAGMIVAAFMYKPGGYGISELPGVMLGVIARLVG